jgi:NitT/TauT family transport system ATP-binding protein
VDYSLKGRTFAALSSTSLDVPAERTVSLVGPSGCGKTTLLNVIGGFIKATSGQVLVGGVPVSGPGAERAMVFQADAVFPWLTVRQNLLYGPRIRKALDQTALDRCSKYLELMGLTAFADEYPKVLSGGMRKRVDVARAYVNDSAIMLLDEPFGALDDFTKSYLQDELIRLSLVEPKTTVFVTHDIEEAIYVGDVVVVMATRPGRIAEQIEVPFPRDRVASIKDSDEFQQVRQHIQRLLRLELTSAMKREEGAA